MLSKRDPIFWTAIAIFAVAILLGAIADNAFFLLGIAAYLLRPTVHSLGFARQLVDERQLSIQYQASNVGFVALVVGNVAIILALMAKGDHTWQMVNAVLLGALAVRALAGLVMVGDPAVAGPRIVMAVGFFVALFGALEGGVGGIVAHVLPGIIVIALGLAARKLPRVIAAVLMLMVALIVGTLAAQLARGGSNLQWATVWALTLICVPLGTAAVCLVRGASAEAEGTP